MGRAASFSPPDLQSNGVLQRAMADNKWNKLQADDARTWYEHFLEVCYTYPGAIVYLMTPDADELWHTHITFTRAYRTYCESILGYYLDHNPVVPRRAPTADEKRTAQVHYKKWTAKTAKTSTKVLPDMIIQCHP